MQDATVEEPSAPVRPPTAGHKRAKYTSKACEYCHRRKIKCDGESPCAACRSKDRECVKDYAPTHRSLLHKKRKRTQQAELSTTEDEFEATSTTNLNNIRLLERISGIERQLHHLVSSLQRPSEPRILADRVESLRHGDEAADDDQTTDPHTSGAGASGPDFEPVDEPSYVGETSISHTLQQVENSLHGLGLPTKEVNTPVVVSPSSALLNEAATGSSSSSRKEVLQILARHQLPPNKAEWDILLDLYCEDVHPLYPFLHLPSLRRSYAQLMGEDVLDTVGKDSFAQVILCLALGRCTTSVRAETSEGTQSSGWAFYTAALECVGEVNNPLRETSMGLPRLQVLTLMIVYLIRLEANERAQKVLSLTVVQAQHLGLHREVVLASAPRFVAECSRRLWWCLYVLDRRVALDIGQPFLIQDTNTDTNLPQLLSEAFMEELCRSSATSASDDGNFPVGSSGDEDCHSPIPYLIAMTGYAKIVGKAWNELYQAHCMDRASDPALTVSFEDLLSLWKQGLPAILSCDEKNSHEHHQPPDKPMRSWQLKNKFLIHIRTLWLRILIRKPLRSRSTPITWMQIQNFDNEAVCIALADRIVAFFARIFEPYRIYTFPFLQYLLGAASTILGLIIRVPVFRSRHTHSLVQAAQMMNTFCRKTWVSGKTLRSVKRFTDMMAKVVSQNQNSSLKGLQPRGTSSHDSVTTVNNAVPVVSGKAPVEGTRRNSASLAGWATGNAAPASSNLHCHEQEHDHSRSVNDPTRPTDHAGIPTHMPEGDASYFYSLISPPYDIMDAPSLGSGVEPLGPLSWDLESLVMADYPFERSVSDRNLMQGSGEMRYEDIVAAIY
ncbi:fungal-specific transcription factor domain-containing protein [Aspergillus spectabilis]